MHNFEAAIFDMDGLLLDSERLAFDAFKATCKMYDLGDQSHIFMQCVGTNPVLGKSILNRGLGDLIDTEKFGRTWEKLYAELSFEQPVPLKKGANKLLEYILATDTPIAVATSTKTQLARRKLRDSGILDYFDILIGGDQVTHSKPNPEVYLKVASKLSRKASECIAFEDSPNGVKSATSAGMTVVQIPDLITPDEELLSLGHIVLDNLEDVIEYKF